jgi:hypothetical protein
MKKAFIILFLLISIIVNATTYYVKNGGNDGAAGTSDGTAWATIAKVNATISGGDIVLFKRGDTWRNEPIHPAAGSSGAYTTYGAYSTGEKPKILGSLTANSGWTNLGSNIWQITGWTVDVGNVIFNNEASCGYKVMSASPTLDTQGKFWYDYVNDRVRMYSTSDPATYYSNIEFALSKDAIHTDLSATYVIYEDLDFRYWGQCVMQNAPSYTKYQRLNISYIGGGDAAQMNGSGWYGTRWGNGIQAWEGDGHDITIEGNRVDQVYDAGISSQGAGQGDLYTAYNMWIRNNIVTKCEYNFEFWLRPAGSSVHDIYVEHNTFAYAGDGWGHNQRPDGNSGEHIAMIQFTASISNIYIRNNIFYLADLTLILWDYPSPLQDMHLDYNLYYNASNYVGIWIGYADTYYATFAEFQTYYNVETNGVGADPLFVDPTNNNFHLQEGSPAIGAGLTVSGVTTDYDGVAYEATPSIGALEYEAGVGDVLVTSITVSGTGGATTISTNDGTLQMLASVLPVDATNAVVAWSVVSGGTYGSISIGGLLTALGNGSVTVRATATDGSGVYDDQVIVISNQVDTKTVLQYGGSVITSGGSVIVIIR